MGALRTIYRFWLSLLTLAIVLQVAFAGYGAFYAADKVSDTSIDENTFEDGFGVHTGFGYLILLGALVAVILALLARPGKRTVLITLGGLGLVMVQVVLAWIGEEVPAVGGLHPVNAFLILGLFGSLAGKEWRAKRAGMGVEPAPATTPPA